ncbi:MAG: hypothetical protein ABEK04_00285 [Candidatus Nanohalobium sp.]
MTDTLWDKALKKSKLLQNHLKSKKLAQELEEVIGDSKIHNLTPDSEDNRGFLSLWISMASLRKRASKVEKDLDKFEEDIDYLFQKMDDLEDQIEDINGVLYDEQAETAEYIRNLTAKKYKAYQRLLEARNSDTTQKEIAEELDIDEAVLSRFKKDFKDNNIL